MTSDQAGGWVRGRLSAMAQNSAEVISIVTADQRIAVTIGGRSRRREKVEPRRPITITTSPIMSRGGHPPARNARDAQSPAIASEPRVRRRSIVPSMASPRIMSRPAAADRSIRARLPNQQNPKKIAARLPSVRDIPQASSQPPRIEATAAGHRTAPKVGRPPELRRNRT